jgi:ligand-binding SRPBCC domain-containing protein
MNKIELSTHIGAPIDRCFDLARSIDLHKISVKQTREEAVGGVTSGLLGLNQRVLWQATHLGVRQSMEVRISKFTPPFFFTDELVNGLFQSMIHDHFFYDIGNETVMIDHFYYDTPLGIIGEAANLLFFKGYLTRLLTQRNEIICEYAETNKWKDVLPAPKMQVSIVC